LVVDTSSPRRAETLDLLRAVAALGVVWLHMGGLADKTGVPARFSDVGETGVQLFFVLSGYLITTSVLSRSFSTRSYIVNRSFRILPAYFVSIMLVLFLQDSSSLMTTAGWKDITAHVFLVQSWFVNYRTSINPVLWTLSIEWLFYIFMFVCAPLIRRPRLRWLLVAAMFAGSIAYRLWISHRYAGQPGLLNYHYKQLPGLLDQFACGMVAAFLVRHRSVRRVLSERVVAGTGVAVALTGVLMALALFHRYGPNRHPDGYWEHSAMIVFWPLVFCGAIALLVVCILPFETTLAPWIRRSGLGFIGLASYSLYLLHPLVTGTFTRSYRPAIATVSGPLYFAMALVAVLVTAIGGYLLVEKPFMERRKRYLVRKAAPSLAPVEMEARVAQPPVPVG
jgi:peptidoglycan/LPS O-acetylase OafA/YrhL